jgi:hypothetical protein
MTKGVALFKVQYNSDANSFHCSGIVFKHLFSQDHRDRVTTLQEEKNNVLSSSPEEEATTARAHLQHVHDNVMHQVLEVIFRTMLDVFETINNA